ncbi:MAG: 6-bladed beta-propeller [Candidatus Aminicenantes bacterium]|nr:6-bladed beta-propeller [Candidatus Aminicenantes bacterium]
MKKTVVFITFFICCLSLFPGGNLIENKDKPLKGEWDFKPELLWQVENAGDDVLVRVGSIQVDDAGNIYVMELSQFKIFVFAPDGKFLYAFGKKGEGPGEIKNAYRFFLLDDRVIIPELGKFSFFTLQGKFMNSVNTGRMIAPIVFLDANHFLHTGGLLPREKESSGRLYLFDIETRKDRVISEIPLEDALTAASGGMQIVLKDSATTAAIVLGLKEKHLYFGKSDKYLVKKTDLDGSEIFSFSLYGRKRKKISPAFKRKRFENVRVNGRKMSKEMIDQMVNSMPDKVPFFSRIMIDHNGFIHVFVSDLENESGQEIDIFSPEGKYLYHGEIKMPDNYIIRGGLTFKDNYLHLFAEDEEGEGKLLKFKINMPKKL